MVTRRGLADLEARSYLDVGLLWLVVLGYFARVLLLLLTEGSNDIRTWLDFAESVDRFGLADTYVEYPLFNHPPLTGLWGGLALAISNLTGVPFRVAFKLPSLAAELGTGLLLFAIWRGRRESLTGLRVLAVYATSLAPMLISAYHGNTDALYFFFSLLAAYCLEARRSPLLAGLALGAALNVKLIPILIALPLASCCRSVRELVRFGVGGLIALTPFAVALSAFDAEARNAFIQNVFYYRSNVETWGTDLIVRVLVAATSLSLPDVSLAIRRGGYWYGAHSGSILLGVSFLVALFNLAAAKRKLDAYALSLIGFWIFLFLGSSFGTQYMGCVIAPVLACSLANGMLVSTVLGVSLVVIYLHYVVYWTPLFTSHGALPREFATLAVLCWLVVTGVVFRLVQRARGLAPHVSAK